MRVLIVGAGAVGGYFGGRLLEAGADVTFLVRPRRRDQLAAGGLVLKSPLGDFAAPVATVLAEEIDRPADLIILACKAYDLDGAMLSFADAVGPNTAILPLLNGMAHLDRLSARFGESAVLGGLCSLAVTIDGNGHVLHLNTLHNLAFGERQGGTSDRIEAIARMLTGTNIAWTASPAITQEMWEKWVFLASLAGSTCLMRAGIGDIIAAGGLETITTLLDETQAIATTAGHGARPEVLAKYRALLVDPTSTLTASMLRDVEKGGATEADHVLGDLLARGGAAGLDTPVLDLAYSHLKAYAARRRRETA